MIDFANISTTYEANTIKIAFKVQNWPFSALQNYLSIKFDSAASETSENEESCMNGGTDEAGNLRWFMLYIGELALYLLAFIYIFNETKYTIAF